MRHLVIAILMSLFTAGPVFASGIGDHPGAPAEKSGDGKDDSGVEKVTPDVDQIVPAAEKKSFLRSAVLTTRWIWSRAPSAKTFLRLTPCGDFLCRLWDVGGSRETREQQRLDGDIAATTADNPHSSSSWADPERDIAATTWDNPHPSSSSAGPHYNIVVTTADNPHPNSSWAVRVSDEQQFAKELLASLAERVKNHFAEEYRKEMPQADVSSLDRPLPAYYDPDTEPFVKARQFIYRAIPNRQEFLADALRAFSSNDDLKSRYFSEPRRRKTLYMNLISKIDWKEHYEWFRTIQDHADLLARLSHNPEVQNDAHDRLARCAWQARQLVVENLVGQWPKIVQEVLPDLFIGEAANLAYRPKKSCVPRSVFGE